jgi:triosephosphate isomerase
MNKRFITSAHIHELRQQGLTQLEIRKSDVITPDALDTAKKLGILLHLPSTRKPLVAGNWKMNGDPSFTMSFLSDLAEWASLQRDFFTHVDCMVAPPHPLLLAALQVLTDSQIKLAAQDGMVEDSGAFTGQVSLSMVKSCGAEMVILGHSERRHIYGETNQLISDKIQKALSLNLLPILCVGETLAEKEAGQAESVVRQQLEIPLQALHKNNPQTLVVAYEPVWAIGTGKVATTEDIASMHLHIRNTCREFVGDAYASHLRILYGGSVNGKNSFSMAQIPNVDGVLVGGASLKQTEFRTILENFIQDQSLL